MWQLWRPGSTAWPVASTTSAPAASGWASISSTGPTATMVVPSNSTEPGSNTWRVPDIGRTVALRIRIADI